MISDNAAIPLASAGAPYSIRPYILFLFAFAAITSISFTLTPSSTGVGTHRQLGLPPCGFLTVTGHPCPSCGLTTSFAYLVRGQILNSLKAQPFGTIFYAAMILVAIVSGFSIWNRIPVSRIISSDYFERSQYALLIFFFLGWAYKIYVMW
jgi:hypothetical protein